MVVRCIQTSAGSARWKVRFDTGLNPDLTIVVRMRPGNDAPLDYYLLPRLDLHQAVLLLCEFNGLSIDSYRFNDLGHFYAMTARKDISEAA